jgi:RNA polymerase sigma factor (sigma-70 family)
VTNPIATLVEQARSGSREAYGQLVEICWSRLVRLARSVVGDLEAEDVVQEALVLAWQRIDSLRNAEQFPSWIARITFRRCLRRARRNRGRVDMDTLPEPSHSPNPGDAIAVWQVLSRLAPKQRAVFHLTIVEGMTDTEIAPLLGIAVASVRAHRRRARESVARILQGGRHATV